MRVLVVDDERNIRESIQRLLEFEGIDSACAQDGREAVEILRSETFDAIVADLKMPVMGGQELLERIRDEGYGSPVIMISALGEIGDAVKALKTGAVDYLIKPFDPDELIHKIRAAVSNRRRENQIEAGARTSATDFRLIGEGRAARALRRLVEKIAATDTTVLITGESGSGKEVVARRIHAGSSRSEEPFVAVNIGGVHENLMESELFGHEKGAFTGAEARRIGLFELAGAGSLFLDEIGEMPLPLQVKLLRVLQERRIRRLGGTRDIPVGARILSATNRDIETMVEEGRFREDLYYRLNVARVAVPPLRERVEDLPLLAGFLLEKLRSRMGRRAPCASERAPWTRWRDIPSRAMSESSRISWSAPSSTPKAGRSSPPTSTSRGVRQPKAAGAARSPRPLRARPRRHPPSIRWSARPSRGCWRSWAATAPRPPRNSGSAEGPYSTR